MVKIVLVLLLGLTRLFAIRGETQSRIVGGSAAKEGQFPHQVSLRYKNRHICGGSIVSPSTVVTAAHCVHRTSEDRLVVVVGTSTLDEGGVFFTIKDINIHEDFVYHKFLHDIAVLKLNRPIKYGKYIQPISLASSKPRDEQSLTLSGWGRTSFRSGAPNDLQYIELTNFDLRRCKKLLAMHNTVSPGTLCTTSYGTGYGACKGDSGGPLINHHNELVGITSWGVPCAKGLPDVFTDVYYHRGWIQNQIDDEGGEDDDE